MIIFMEGETVNLCAHIAKNLHLKVCDRQAESGKTRDEYMTWLISTFYEWEEKSKMYNNEDMRTVAFQSPGRSLNSSNNT